MRFLFEKNETTRETDEMNDEVAAAGHSAPNWHEQPQSYITKDREAIPCGARPNVCDVNSR